MAERHMERERSAHKQYAGIINVVSSAQRALVPGGGLLGFITAYGLLKRGLQVTEKKTVGIVGMAIENFINRVLHGI